MALFRTPATIVDPRINPNRMNPGLRYECCDQKKDRLSNRLEHAILSCALISLSCF